jgi:hypothetical protein
LKCHNYDGWYILWHEIITWNATRSPTELVRRHYTESSKIITWNATISPTALSPSAFHREFKNNYLKCHPITDGNTDGISPSVFHREFENNYLKCHQITDGHTDEFKYVGKLSAVQFYRQHYWRTARISKGCALNAPLTA